MEIISSNQKKPFEDKTNFFLPFHEEFCNICGIKGKKTKKTPLLEVFTALIRRSKNMKKNTLWELFPLEMWGEITQNNPTNTFSYKTNIIFTQHIIYLHQINLFFCWKKLMVIKINSTRVIRHQGFFFSPSKSISLCPKQWIFLLIFNNYTQAEGWERRSIKLERENCWEK